MWSFMVLPQPHFMTQYKNHSVSCPKLCLLVIILNGLGVRISQQCGLSVEGPERSNGRLFKFAVNLPAMQEMRIRSLAWEDSSGGGNGHPFQYSCLENPMDGGSLVGCSPLGSRRFRHDLAAEKQQRGGINVQKFKGKKNQATLGVGQDFNSAHCHGKGEIPGNPKSPCF